MIIRLNLFGVTGTATFIEFRPSRGILRLNLFGVTGTATILCSPSSFMVFSASISLESRVLRLGDRLEYPRVEFPPQSLWSHGYCDEGKVHPTKQSSSRLNLFGVTGTATMPRMPARPFPVAASISLESRVLRQVPSWRAPDPSLPPQSLWSHGYCDRSARADQAM